MSVITPFVDSSVLSCGAMQPNFEGRPRAAPSSGTPPIPLFVPPRETSTPVVVSNPVQVVPQVVEIANPALQSFPAAYAIPSVYPYQVAFPVAQQATIAQQGLQMQLQASSLQAWFPTQQFAVAKTAPVVAAGTVPILQPQPDMTQACYANQIETELGGRPLTLPSDECLDVEALEESLGIQPEKKSKKNDSKKDSKGKSATEPSENRCPLFRPPLPPRNREVLVSRSCFAEVECERNGHVLFR